MCYSNNKQGGYKVINLNICKLTFSRRLINTCNPLFLKNLFYALLLIVFMTAGLSGCGKKVQPVHSIVKTPPRPLKAKTPENVQVALALGTGGFRGIAHLGVIEVLEKEGIPIDLIVGTSAGSMVGAFYCAYPKIALIKDEVMTLSKEDLVDSMKIPLKGDELERFIIKKLRKVQNFEQLKIPLVVVATSLNTNQVYLINSGPLAPAIHASSAMPHFFAPVCLYGQVLTDGGVLEAVPVEVARKYKPKMVIGVNVYPPSPTTPTNKASDLFNRAIDVSYHKFCHMQVSEADVAINPNLFGFELFDDKHNKEAYELGRKAAIAALPKIKAEMARRGIERRHPHDLRKKDVAK